MAGRYAELLNLPLVVMHKRRTGFSTTETTHVVGDIKGRRPIIIDDLMAGGSVLKQIDVLYEKAPKAKPASRSPTRCCCPPPWTF
jgi:ribose-phosphate pyrophosphokinase